MQRLVTAVCVLTALAVPAQGQGQRDPDPDSRGWGSVTGGWGWVNCGECGVSETGLGLGFEMGLTIDETFLVGLAINNVSAKSHRGGGGENDVGVLAPIVRFYPFPARGFFLRGGVGLGLSGFDAFLDARVGTMIGLGWDIALGSSGKALTPIVNGAQVGTSGQTSRFMQIGLGLTFH